MMSFLALEAEAVFDIWVGDALTEAMRVAGGDPDNAAEVEAFHQGELHRACVDAGTVADSE